MYLLRCMSSEVGTKRPTSALQQFRLPRVSGPKADPTGRAVHDPTRTHHLQEPSHDLNRSVRAELLSLTIQTLPSVTPIQPMRSRSFTADMLPAGGVNVDGCWSGQGVGTEIGVGSRSQAVGARGHDRKIGARQPRHWRVGHRQGGIDERSRGPRPRRGGSVGAFVSAAALGHAGRSSPRTADRGAGRADRVDCGARTPKPNQDFQRGADSHNRQAWPAKAAPHRIVDAAYGTSNTLFDGSARVAPDELMCSVL